MVALVAGHYLEEERRLPLEVLGYSVDLSPVLRREGEFVTPLQ